MYADYAEITSQGLAKFELPYRTWEDDFDGNRPVPYLIVSKNIGGYAVAEELPYKHYCWDLTDYTNTLAVERDMPEFGWMRPISMKRHYRDLFRLGYEDEDYEGYDEWLDERQAREDYEDLKASSMIWG